MRVLIWVLAAVAATAPGLVLRTTDTHLGDEASAVLFGMAIVGGAFLLSWASEVAELDIPRTLAITVLAVIAVLPEYAVDVYLAWTAAGNEENLSLATANMTGANRLLIGLGWSLVVFLCWLRYRQSTVRISRGGTPSLLILLLATAYAFTIVIKGYLHIADTFVLGALFGVYVWMSFKGGVEEPHLIGPSAVIGTLPALPRRIVVVAMFAYAAAVIVLSAEPFVEGLKGTGEALGVSEFVLIQWVAPLASEAPEMLLAAIFVLRGRGEDGLGILVSSKVNQWTLLVATLPAAYDISSGALIGMPLDSRQTTEVFLTAAQSLFAVAILLDLRIHLKEAGLLFVLFTTQLFIPIEEAHLAFASLYLLLTVGIFAINRDRLTALPQLFYTTLARRGEEKG